MDYLQMYTKNPFFEKRYLQPEILYSYLESNADIEKRIVGYSTNELPIYEIIWGKGDINILAWSQMHGNESNSSLAFLDFIETWRKNKKEFENLYNDITLNFVIMLNPDGSKSWTRNNAKNIDLNRDFHDNKSIELPILKKVINNKKYDYALNLHEQRTIFSTDGMVHPATLSFLAPSEEITRKITQTRKKSMAVIAALSGVLNRLIPNQIGRYTDEFYPNATGDNIMNMGIPVILFEGGHYRDDYTREEQRKYYSVALYHTFKEIARLNGSTEGWEKYEDIPENKDSHYDIVLRNIKISENNEDTVDLGIHFKEELDSENREITLKPIIVSIEKNENKKGWKEINCANKIIAKAKEKLQLGKEINLDFI